ncbi:hypothetical protein GCM10025864_37850 [Luteimicrobium album]|uniref:Uncharacterized protein n=1 Tax=Luteimicrobium album TaxID=1054550 RepID=A0ABQ6I6W0_9MICO|nr:hypothetical protein GCM10025864_37850 [Luteimicrobium album]
MRGSDLVGDPGVDRTGDAGVAEAPHDLGGDDRTERRDPWSRVPAPMTIKPVRTEVRRDHASAITEVGTSPRKHVASRTVPTTTSCAGVRCPTSTWNRSRSVDMSANSRLDEAA